MLHQLFRTVEVEKYEKMQQNNQISFTTVSFIGPDFSTYFTAELHSSELDKAAWRDRDAVK